MCENHKRIAIISEGHSESTLPLVNALFKKGCEVDYYVIARSSNVSVDAAPIRLSSIRLGVNLIDNEQLGTLIGYFSADKVRVFVVRLARPYLSVPVVRYALKFTNFFIVKFFGLYLNKQKYDLVNIATRYNTSDVEYLASIVRPKMVFSLHEVCNHLSPDYDAPTTLLKQILKNRLDIVLHSQKSYDDILKYKLFDKESLHIIHFGKFETYSLFKPAPIKDLPKKYILFLGVINEYKGIEIMYDLVRAYPEDYKDVQFVIAGKGYVPIIDKMKEDNHFTIINRYISNEELAYLFEKSFFVICPYKSISQSGIPQTAFVFNKPILSSNIESFKEIINAPRFGLYVETANIEEWNKCVQRLWRTNEVESMTRNLEQFETVLPLFSWNNIADMYLEFVK